MVFRIAIPISSMPRPLANLMLLPLVCGLLLSTYTCACVTAADVTDTSTLSESGLQIHHVIYFIGLAKVKPNLSGDLNIDNRKITFVTAGSTTEIPERAIVAYSIEHDTVPLIKGTPGLVASMAPYGAGQVISMIRNASDTLTLLYRDSDHAIHGTVFLLPKGRGEDAVHTLEKFGIAPRDYPRAGEIGSEEPINRADPASSEGKPSLEVALVTESAEGVPAAFPVAIYEELIEGLAKDGEFARVWRQGDAHAEPNVLVLKIDVQGLTKGNERTRSLIPFWGSTSIKTEVQVQDSNKKVLLAQQNGAAIRFHGENIGVSHALCRKVEKELKKIVNGAGAT